jgi:uncharacterized protein YqeY
VTLTERIQTEMKAAIAAAGATSKKVMGPVIKAVQAQAAGLTSSTNSRG